MLGEAGGGCVVCVLLLLLFANSGGAQAGGDGRSGVTAVFPSSPFPVCVQSLYVRLLFIVCCVLLLYDCGPGRN